MGRVTFMQCLLFIEGILMFGALCSLALKKCDKDEIEYEFTECDSFDGRWRVAVPKKPEECETSEVPVRQQQCSFSCLPGQYVDVTSPTLECKQCAKGTYSVGGGVRFTNWDKLPMGFESKSSDLSYHSYYYDSEYYGEQKGINCSKSGWIPRGDSIASPGDQCTAELSYAVTLQKDGLLKFDYHFTDSYNSVFRVYVQNERCVVSDTGGNDVYPPSTSEYEWNVQEIPLKAGRNLITFQATGITYDAVEKREPVLIKYVQVQGVSFTSECTLCEAGSYNNEEGQGSCKVCGANTFSETGAETCSSCNQKTEYSMPGSANCTQRKPCNKLDYYQIRTACDKDRKTQVKYMWTEPKICLEDLDGAVQLPASGAKEDCPPCNPGMFFNNSDCAFCPANHFSKGTEDKCEACAVSTTPVYGYDLRWWHSIPPHMTAHCFSVSNRGCASKQGWQPYGTHLSSGFNHADDVYLVLHLSVGGFMKPHNLQNAKAGQYGTVTFTFDMECTEKCTMHFKKTNRYGTTTTIQSWDGQHTKEKYQYIITSNYGTKFTWTFQKVQSDIDLDGVSYKAANDRLNIYFINVTNTVDGGAALCKECPVTSGNAGCVSCPDGNYVDRKAKKCEPCPANTYLNVENPYDIEACKACGPGLISDIGSVSCHSNCKFHSLKFDRTFDFSKLNGTHSIQGPNAFTSRGSRYYHVYNMSLCGHPEPKALCTSNISAMTGAEETFNLTSSVCRLTMIPGQKLLSTQPLSLGDHSEGIFENFSNELLLGRIMNDVTSNSSSSSKNSTSDKEKPAPEQSVFAKGNGPVNNASVAFTFRYKTHSFTPACPHGRSVWVTLLCDPTAKDTGAIELPTKCLDGTCDGCRFEFLWRTQEACPVCSPADYNKVKSSCEHGKKSIHYMWTEPKLCHDGVSLPHTISSKCSIFEQSVGAAMKDFKIVLGVVAAIVVLMLFSVFGLWYKNRKLTYKYHRLVHNASGMPGELPEVEKCAIDEGEEDDDEEVHFRIGAKDRGKKIFNKLKGMAGGSKKRGKVSFDDEDEEFFESVQLDQGKIPLHDG